MFTPVNPNFATVKVGCNKGCTLHGHVCMMFLKNVYAVMLLYFIQCRMRRLSHHGNNSVQK